MTTIAWDGRMLAADRMGVLDDFKFDDGPKLRALSGGRYVACCGMAQIVERVLPWMETGGQRPEMPESASFSAILVTSDGDAFLIENNLIPMPIASGQRFAIGSGAQFALGAMEAGASAELAIRIANDLCVYSGFGVDWVDFGVPVHPNGTGRVLATSRGSAAL